MRLHPPSWLHLVLCVGSTVLANGLGSCVDVKCPLEHGTSDTASCQVANTTLNAVGVSQFTVPLPSVGADQNESSTATTAKATLSWTVGVSNLHHIVSEEDDDFRRNIDRIYYLGSPADIDLTSDDLPYAGCALYMSGSSHANIFYDAAANIRSKSTYCQTLMGFSCHDNIQSSIQAYAKSLQNADNSTASTQTSCEEMAAHVQASLPTACPRLDASITVTGVALTGSDAESPISGEANSTSNCWPTLPKVADLTRAFSYNVTSMVFNNETFPALLGETPLWNVFYSLSNDTEGALADPDVQLLCLRPIDENLDVKSEEQAGAGASSAAGGLGWTRWNVIGLALATAFLSGAV